MVENIGQNGTAERRWDETRRQQLSLVTLFLGEKGKLNGIICEKKTRVSAAKS